MRGMSGRVSMALAGILLAAQFALPFKAAAHDHQNYEAKLLEVLSAIRVGNNDKALTLTRQLLETYPNSRVGRLIQGDLLTAKYSTLSSPGASLSPQHSQAVADLIDEINVRWNYSSLPDPAKEGLIPDTLVAPAPSTDRLIYADLSRSRMYLYRVDSDGVVSLASDLYMTMGLKGAGKEREGDKRTPVGVYHITSYIPGSQLEDRYGPGALPISYPNSLDRSLKRTGHGIWIHGTESDYQNRAPKASDGCLSLNNGDFLDLAGMISGHGRIPVIIDTDPEWVQPHALKTTRMQLSEALENWRQDWESNDTAKFLLHYSRSEFSTADQDYRGFVRRKTSIGRSQTFVKVEISDIEIYGYPGHDGVYVADFTQKFESNLFSGTTRKTLHWRLIDGHWRIIHEGLGSIRRPPVLVVSPPSGQNLNRG